MNKRKFTQYDYICMFPVEARQQIEIDVRQAITGDFAFYETNDIIENVMSSRLIDVYNGEDDYITRSMIKHWLHLANTL